MPSIATAEGPQARTEARRGVPQYIAHFVIRTSRYAESVAWYKRFFDAEEVHVQPGITFLTWDDEHHRVAVYEVPGLAECSKTAAGVDHIAFTMRDVGELIAAYKRLKVDQVMPALSINHGPTTSLYYRDPDGVSIELQVDNSAQPGGARGFFDSEAFVKNPIGILFEPDELVARYEAGESADTLLARPEGPVPILDY